MKFGLTYDNQPRKFLKRVGIELVKRILNRITILSNDPFPSDVKRVSVHKEKVFRVRVGAYRILYRVNYQSNRVIIIKIDKRPRVY